MALFSIFDFAGQHISPVLVHQNATSFVVQIAYLTDEIAEMLDVSQIQHWYGHTSVASGED